MTTHPGHVASRIVPAALAVLLLAGACSATARRQPVGRSSSGARPAAAPAVDQGCPKTAPKRPTNTGAALTKSLVPAAAERLVLCRYPGSMEQAGPSARTVLSDHATVESWRQKFNALPAAPAGRRFCPFDDGSVVLAGFVGTQGSTTVRVEERGCRDVTNGALTRTATDDLITGLRAAH